MLVGVDGLLEELVHLGGLVWVEVGVEVFDDFSVGLFELDGFCWGQDFGLSALEGVVDLL